MMFYAWAIKRETGTSVQRTRSESGAAATGLFPALLPAVNINFLLLFFLMLYDINKVNLETTDYLYSNTNLWKSLPQDLSRTDSPVLFFKDCQVVLPQTCWQAKRAIGRITVFFQDANWRAGDVPPLLHNAARLLSLAAGATAHGDGTFASCFRSLIPCRSCTES